MRNSIVPTWPVFVNVGLSVAQQKIFLEGIVMSRADELYRQTCIDILENGFYDTDLEVRPKWADGTPAHTVKKFGVVNRYNLKEEFPIMTLRRTYWKSAVDELLWIW